MSSQRSGRSSPTRLRAAEIAYLILALGALMVLLIAGSRSRWTAVELAVGLAAYFGALRFVTRREVVAAERFRLVLNYLTTFWLYGATSRISAALGSTPRDRALLGIDEFLFGRTPAVAMEAWFRPWLTDTLSVCYLSYHVYLFTVVVWAMQQPQAGIRRLSAALFSGFAVGFFGYLFVPAVGPGIAFPALFSRALGGGTLTQLNDAVVALGSALYGNFPSLHLLVLLLLLDHDWHECRARFWLMLVPAAGMLAATMYLRYHYAADLIAAAALFPLVRAACRRGA